MSKRTLDSFFAPPVKKARLDNESIIRPQVASNASTSHVTYPWAVPSLPSHIEDEISMLVTAEGKAISNQPHLDLLYFQPFIPKQVEHELFKFLRGNLFFYRVKYTIKRFGKETLINTPRYTTVFGVDETSRFSENSSLTLVDSTDPSRQARQGKYKCQPRPIPACLDLLRKVTEAATNTSYNFCLVNYYATGNDSISYHSDDESFLGHDPAIASFTLGAKRDFVMKHKPPKDGQAAVESTTIKLPLASGDMVLMRGETQSNWLHSIPKRKGPDADKGRVNITLRKALVPAGTENYYRYNVGDGEVYKWNDQRKEMVPWS